MLVDGQGWPRTSDKINVVHITRIGKITPVINIVLNYACLLSGV